MLKGVYEVQIQLSECRTMQTNGQGPYCFFAEALPGCIYFEFLHHANYHSTYADRFYTCMIHHKDGHIPSPLIMFTFTALRYALLEWQNNKGVHLKYFKSTLIVDRSDRSNFFNYKNDHGKNAFCRAATGRTLLHSPGIADTNTFLMNTWNILQERYQQRVYKNTIATTKHQIQEVEDPTPAAIISMEAESVANPIHHYYVTSEVALEEPEIGSSDQNFPIDNNCTNHKLNVGMAGRCEDYNDEGDESNNRDAIPGAGRQ
jgi:hypothetical protein